MKINDTFLSFQISILFRILNKNLIEDFYQQNKCFNSNTCYVCNPSCQRCDFGKLRPAPRETISHIFWDCPIISDILTDLNRIISNGVLSYEELKMTIFLGCTIPVTFNIETTNIICFMYYMFSTRNNRRIYNTSKLKQFLFYHTSRIDKPLFVEYEHET